MAKGLTTDQIYNLNNSMSAAQDVALGTVLDALMDASGSLTSITSGTLTPTSASVSVATGLTTVTAALISFSGSPTLKHMWNTITPSSGNVIINTYAPTNASTVTPIATTGSWVALYWVALGTM